MKIPKNVLIGGAAIFIVCFSLMSYADQAVYSGKYDHSKHYFDYAEKSEFNHKKRKHGERRAQFQHKHSLKKHHRKHRHHGNKRQHYYEEQRHHHHRRRHHYRWHNSGFSIILDFLHKSH